MSQQSQQLGHFSNRPVETAVLRQILEDDFVEFISYFFYIQEGMRFRWNDHHYKIIDALMKCYRHETKRLIINIPPRYSKTEIVVIMFSAWCLAKHPRAQFIHLSFSGELAHDNSARIRELVLRDEFQALWPTQLNADRSAKSLWRTRQGGGLKAGAAGSTVTGFGCGLLDGEEGDDPKNLVFGGAMLVDDPLKPDDAESDAERYNVNKRFNGTIKSRLNAPWTPVIVIMQRLHDDDPTGFLLQGGTGEEWDHLKIPVVREDGSPLWTLRHGVEDLAAIQVADKAVWHGQYMQEPVPDDGDYFTKENARYYVGALPKDLNYYGASDYAAEDKQDRDFTEHGVFGIAPDGTIYVVDWWYGQAKTDVWIEEKIDLIKKWEPMMWGGETGPIKSAIEPFLMKRMIEENVAVPMHWVTHSTPNHKKSMARGMQGLWEQNRIYFPKDKPWADRVISQMCRFPKGTLDDAVDVMGIFGRMLARVWEQEGDRKTPPITNKLMQDPLVIESFAPRTSNQDW